MRITKFIVYVHKDIMDKPSDLADAVFAHFVKKEMDTAERKKFLAQVMKAPTDKHRMQVIDAWVSVRDAATFPFRHEPKEESDADTEATRGVPMDDGADGESE